MTYNAKNYTTQGGDLTVIGGKLRIEGELEYGDGAVVPGGGGSSDSVQKGSMPYMALISEGSTVTDEDFNDLILNLRECGLMPSSKPVSPMEIAVSMASSPPEEVIKADNEFCTVNLEDDTITISAPFSQLPSFQHEGETGKWVCLAVDTGTGDITEVTMDDEPFTQADVTLATTCGCSAGTFVLYLNVQAIKAEAKVITLDADGYATAELTIRAVDTEDDV